MALQQLLTSQFSCSQHKFCFHGNYTEAQIHPIFTIRLHFTQKVVGELPFLLHQNCLHIKEHFLRKFKKILSRGFGATLILQNIKVYCVYKPETPRRRGLAECVISTLIRMPRENKTTAVQHDIIALQE